MHDHKLYTVQCFDMLQSVFSLILPCLGQALVKSPTSLWKHSSSLAEAVSWESGNGATGNQGVRSRRSNQPTWNCLRLRCHQSKHLKLWFFVCQLYLASSSHIDSQCHSTSSDHLKLEGSEPLRPGDSLCHAESCQVWGFAGRWIITMDVRTFWLFCFKMARCPKFWAHIGRMGMSQDKL